MLWIKLIRSWRELLITSLSFSLDPNLSFFIVFIVFSFSFFIVFIALFIVPLPQGRKEKVLLSCGSHTTTGIQHTLPCPKFLKDSWPSEVFREISGVMRTFSGAWLRKRDSFFLLISSLKYYWPYGPTSTVPRSSQIHTLTLGCSHFLGLGGFQDFIWSFHSSSLSLLTCGTEFSYVHTVHEKTTLSSYIADTASVIK